MSTLFLSAPRARTTQGSGFYRTFQTILSNGIGPDYGIYSTLIGQDPGDKVVVFDRDQQLQAEGVVANVTRKGKTANGVQRYDVHIRNLTTVPYANPLHVNRCGVAVL
jgi:hypothetical protein